MHLTLLSKIVLAPALQNGARIQMHVNAGGSCPGPRILRRQAPDPRQETGPVLQVAALAYRNQLLVANALEIAVRVPGLLIAKYASSGLDSRGEAKRMRRREQAFLFGEPTAKLTRHIWRGE